MKIQNKQFGEIEFTEDLVLRFDEGVYGFENLKRFLLIKTEEDLFYWLNSIDQPEICFPLIGLRMNDEDYPNKEDAEAFGIVTLNQDPSKITANLKAPVYINQEEKTGYQTIIDDDKYSVNYTLFTEQ